MRSKTNHRRPSFSEEETAGLALPRYSQVVNEVAEMAPVIAAPAVAVRPVLVASKHDKLVLHPSHPFLLVWDIFIFILLVFQAWTVPFEVGVSGGFVWQYYGIPGVLFHLFLSLVFMVDTALCFFRATRDEQGRLVWRLHDVVRH